MDGACNVWGTTNRLSCMRCRVVDLDESVSWFHVPTFRQVLLVNAAEIRYDNTMKSTLALALACSILAAGGCCLVRSIWTSRLREVQDAYVNNPRALKHELQEMQTQHVLLQAEHDNLGLELRSLLQLQAQHEALQETHKEQLLITNLSNRFTSVPKRFF